MSVVKLFPSNFLQSTRKERKKEKCVIEQQDYWIEKLYKNPHTSLTEEAL
jgi:hypothetical protein